MTPVIEVMLNGEKTQLPAGLSVAGLLRHLGLDGERVAVELDRVLVRRPEWDNCLVSAGAQLEVVHFVGGGL